MQDFAQLAIPEQLKENIAKERFHTPTPIQKRAIPFALEGRDILGISQTGSGKTAAFAIPLLAHLLTNQDGHALILTPTRELATQVFAHVKRLLGKASRIGMALLIGGASYHQQMQQLKRHPRLIIATPGRTVDHMERGTLKLNEVSFFVLDEMDRMLDAGFKEELNKISKAFNESAQTLLFSATTTPKVREQAIKFLTDPAVVELKDPLQAKVNLKTEVVKVKSLEKYDHLLGELQARSGSIILFMKTKAQTDQMAERLRRASVEAQSIHGDLPQGKRDRIIRNFRQQKFQVLVATDVAARGLDIPHVEHVINYELPHAVYDYTHRIGRTARAGRSGSVLTIITKADTAKWAVIERMLQGESVEDLPPAKRKKGGFKKKNKRYFSKPRPKKNTKKSS